MSTKQRSPLAARIARAAELFTELAEICEAISRDVAKVEPDYVDQEHSPLGSRLHCRLVRNGTLPGMQVGRRILIRRSDLAAYFDQNKIAPKDRELDKLDRIELEIRKRGGLPRPAKKG